MTNLDLLERLGDIREEYIQEAGEIQKTHIPLGRMWVIAAVVALMLLLVGCVAYTQGWFVDFFAHRSETPLSDSQIALIEEKEQLIGETQVKNGWTVEVRSAIRDGNKAYVILGITAPEDVSLEPEMVDGRNIDWFSAGNAGPFSALEQNPTNLVIHPKDVRPHSLSASWQEDGDGLENTKNYVIELEPDLAGSTVDPFGPEAEWIITIQGIVRNYDDEAYKQHLLNTKYKGEYGVMFTNEETQRIQQQEVLTDERWRFTVTFAENGQVNDQLELLSEPMRTESDFIRRHGSERDMDFVWHREEITLTSILVQPFSVTISHSGNDIYTLGAVSPRFYFPDESNIADDPIFTYAVMKDGSRIRLLSNGGGENYTLLEVESPIVLSELDHILFPDGDKVYADGTIEYGPEPEIPAEAKPEYIVTQTGIYVYCADFDGDGAEDAAIWYDGCFHTLRLLDQDGELRREFQFENGMDVYETYNQRAPEISWEPNQIRQVEILEGGEVIRYFRAEEDGLYLTAGIWQKGGQYFRSTADPEAVYDPLQEAWEPITREAHRRIREDYQVMNYRLRPIGGQE